MDREDGTMIDTDEVLCPCGHAQADHHFGCEALPDEGCPCTAIYPADGSAPWLPSGMRLPRVGDRVVVRLSGECRSEPPAGTYDADHVILGHERWEDGLTGRVGGGEDIDPLLLAAGHRYVVWWDWPRPGVDGELLHGSVYAASELEILADDDGE